MVLVDQLLHKYEYGAVPPEAVAVNLPLSSHNGSLLTMMSTSGPGVSVIVTILDSPI